MGPPGAGKGTQAAVLSAELGVPQIATGDIFRANVTSDTELGRAAKRYLDAGDYAPDSVTNEMVRSRLSEPDASDGFVLDGYPRTVQQVSALDDILAERGTQLDAVVELEVPAEVLVHRLVNRAHRDGRSDDTEDVIRHRQQVYADQTAPLLHEYSRRGMLLQVDGIGEVHEVQARVLAALAPVRGARTQPVSTDNG